MKGVSLPLILLAVAAAACVIWAGLCAGTHASGVGQLRTANDKEQQHPTSVLRFLSIVSPKPKTETTTTANDSTTASGDDDATTSSSSSSSSSSTSGTSTSMTSSGTSSGSSPMASASTSTSTTTDDSTDASSSSSGSSASSTPSGNVSDSSDPFRWTGSNTSYYTGSNVTDNDIVFLDDDNLSIGNVSTAATEVTMPPEPENPIVTPEELHLDDDAFDTSNSTLLPSLPTEPTQPDIWPLIAIGVFTSLAIIFFGWTCFKNRRRASYTEIPSSPGIVV